MAQKTRKKEDMTPTKTGVSHIEVSRYAGEILVQWQVIGSTLTFTEPFKDDRIANGPGR